MSRKEFIETFGGIFEHADWIAQAVWDEGITTADDTMPHLHQRMCDTLMNANIARQDALIHHHPELAASPNRAKSLTADSAREQTKLDDINATQARQLAELNQRYREKFGHPFIIAVAELSPTQILTAIEQRLMGEPQSERDNALQQICKIGEHRMRRLAP